MAGRAPHLVSTAEDREGLKHLYEQLRPVYQEALYGFHRQLRELLERHGYTPTIKYRVKRFNAYFDKLQRVLARREPDKAPVITDLLGVRIICPFLEEIDIIEELLKTHFQVRECEHKANRHSFREFGYDSVHMLVRSDAKLPEQAMPHSEPVIEIQLRTILQDAWAEVEHELIYKSDISLPNESIKRKLASLNATLTLSDLIFQEIRDYQKEIRERDRKRRQMLESKLTPPHCITIADPSPLALEPEAGEVASPLPSVGGSRLERAMFEALRIHSNGELEEAIGLYSQILRMKLTDPLRSLVYNHRGMAYFARSEYEPAVKDFTRAIEYDRGNVRGFKNRGLTFRVLKRYHRSLEDYDAAQALAPDQSDVYWGRAQTHFELQLWSRALEDCRRVLELEPEFAPARMLMKQIHSQAL